MKIINNTDLNNLLRFSKKNLGVYKLVYREYKYLYWFSIILIILSSILLLAYIMFSCFYINLFFEKLSFICCFFFAVVCLVLLYLLEKKTRNKHLKIQESRIKELEKYYCEKGFVCDDIIVINEQLNFRKDKIKSQKDTMFIIFGILCLPIWEVFIESCFLVFSSEQIIKVFLFCIVFSFILLFFIKLCKIGSYLYEENISIKNNVSIIENLIYLNTYIIKKKERAKKYGRK